MFAAFALLLTVVCYRVISGRLGWDDYQWLHNFSPLSAVTLCGAAYLPKRLAVLLPLGMLLVSDLVLNFWVYHAPLLTVEMVPRYVALALIAGLGFALRGRSSAGALLAASVAGSIVFYLVTNTAAWIGEPRYPGGLAGWLQALTSGLPGYPSTWWFYRWTLLSDVTFTALFAACLSWQARTASGASQLAFAGGKSASS